MTTTDPEASVTATFLGHACVLVEVARPGNPRLRILIDPGNLTPPLDSLGPLDAVLVTHAHPDHVDAEQLARVRAAGDVAVFGDADTAAFLADAGVENVVVLGPGDFALDGFRIGVSAHAHETIYPGLPVPTDLAFDLDGHLFAPGDSFAVPDFAVAVMLLPTGAPWMKLAETIDYLKAVAPERAIPVHDGGLAAPHRALHRALISRFAPEGTTVTMLEVGELVEA